VRVHESAISEGDELSCHQRRLYRTMSSNVKASVAAIWTIAHSALYGFHITSLNGVQASVVCHDRSAAVARFGLRECLDLTVSTLGKAILTS
jgi:hypothetical protein